MTLSRPQNKEPWLLIAFFASAMAFVHNSGLDYWLAGHFFSSGEWIYRNNFFLEKVLHKGGVKFSAAIILGLFLWRIFERKKTDPLKKHYLNIALIATLLSLLVVALLKKVTTFPCPWRSQAFMGGQPLIPYSALFSSEFPRGHCFPAGHSSGGYAFLSLYFAYTFVYGKRNWLTLLPGVLIGLVFGMAQQLRGAHFLSHDLATIIVCIFISWVTIWGYYSYGNKYEN